MLGKRPLPSEPVVAPAKTLPSSKETHDVRQGQGQEQRIVTANAQQLRGQPCAVGQAACPSSNPLGTPVVPEV